MIKIRMNDQDFHVDADTSLFDALKNQGYSNNNFAIAINRRFIPRSQYANQLLNEGDTIEILAPMQGG